MGPDCPFCERILFDRVAGRDGGVVWFEPLNPVTPGHVLFLPAIHTEWSEPAAAHEMGACVRRAIRFALREGWWFNLITSFGEAATQSQPHIHLHLVPRLPHDGLHLPWTDQQRTTHG